MKPMIPVTLQFQEPDSKFSKIESLVKKGSFGDVKEVYKHAVSIFLLLSRVNKPGVVERLDSELYGKEVTKCLAYIQKKKFNTVVQGLKNLSSMLLIRSYIGALLREPDVEAFEILSDTMKEYSSALSDLENKDDKTKRRVVNDIKRDLSAIRSYIRSTEKKVEDRLRSHSGNKSLDTWEISSSIEEFIPITQLQYYHGKEKNISSPYDPRTLENIGYE